MTLDEARREEVLKTLREHAKRITAPKRAVVEVLVGAHDHLTADEVTRHVQQVRPDVSPSTVYRILEELEGLALVVHSHTGHAAAVYHLAGRSHGHVTCEVCHVTYEVPSDIFNRVARELDSTLGFELDRHHVALSGICAQCRHRLRVKL
ncbi:MAG: transcriptional repressor [Acidimicrobiaceae bacterium]|nr:transcriptional repressor [Acidimicrobiaceae bacterium]